MKCLLQVIFYLISWFFLCWPQSFVLQTKDYLIIIFIFSQIIRYLSCVSKANDVFLQKMFYK